MWEGGANIVLVEGRKKKSGASNSASKLAAQCRATPATKRFWQKVYPCADLFTMGANILVHKMALLARLEHTYVFAFVMRCGSFFLPELLEEETA